MKEIYGGALDKLDYYNITYSLKYAKVNFLRVEERESKEVKIIDSISEKILRHLEDDTSYLILTGEEIAYIKASLILFLERVATHTELENTDLAIETLYDTFNKFC